MKIHEIKLELLRHGPSHNQLLSPLTPYFALCGNRAVEALHIDVEHAEVTRLISSLRYGASDRDAVIALGVASARVGQIFAGIKGLLAELSAVPQDDLNVIHLRLVLSASELAILPFELMRSPAGFPGEGQALSLQAATPVVLTREVRRTRPTLRWPERPRILVVSASPPEVGEVPTAAHVLAISKALEPLLVTRDNAGLSRYVTVIQRATLAAVREACATTAYTHVHVLAHGAEQGEQADRELGYGLAFHSEGDGAGTDVVSGSRLAAALRCHVAGSADGGFSKPTVVTIASCDSGNMGSVVTPGGSIAHALHEAGIPLVFASQFPLSQRGSVVMTETLYTRLLRGEDPRMVAHPLRQVLHTDCRDTHDWASLIVYAALPPDIDAQLRKARFDSAGHVVDVALARFDVAVKLDAEGKAPVGSGARATNLELLEAAMLSYQELLSTLDGLSERRRANGLLGSAMKSFAQQLHQGSLWPITGGEEQARARGCVEQARDYYKEVFRINASEAWAAVQYLALWAVLDPPDLAEARIARTAEFTRWWSTAEVIARDNLESGERAADLVAAHGALLELAVLAQHLPEDHPARQTARHDAFEHLGYLLATAQSRLESYSMRRQLQRYADWWWLNREELRKLPADLAKRMIERGVPLTYEPR